MHEMSTAMHGMIIEYMRHFNYESNLTGVCFGIANMGLQAILAKDVKSFDKRFYDISEDFLKGYKLTDEEREQMRITGFLDGIELFYQANKYNHLFEEGKAPTKQETMRTAALVMSVKIEEDGGLAYNADFSGVYDKNELIQYLATLKKSIINADPPYQDPVAILLGSSNHSITIGFDPSTNDWIFINSKTSKKCLDEEELAGQIMQGFSLLPDQKIILDSQIYSTQKNKTQMESIISDWMKDETWQKLHEVTDEKVEFQDEENQSWLHMASRHNQPELVKKLLENKKANPNRQNHLGVTPLFQAALNGYLDVVNVFMQHPQIDPNIHEYSHEAEYPFSVALIKDHPQVAMALIKPGMDLNIQSGLGHTPLHLALIRNNNKLLRALLHNKADPNIQNNAKSTPLHIAVGKQNIEAMKMLLETNADPNIYTEERGFHGTALHIAALNGDAECVRLLLAHGADPTKRMFDPNTDDYTGRTAAEWAQENGNEEIVYLLNNPEATQQTAKRPPASYCFAQQTDNSCHVMPFINLGILKKLRQDTSKELEQEGIDLHPHARLPQDANWYQKRHWLPQTFLWTKTWEQAISKAMQSSFGEYQREVLANGIIQGHVYDENGSNFLNNTWNPLEYYARMLLIPFNFTDANMLSADFRLTHQDAAYKTLPLFWDKGKAICYDPLVRDYRELTEVASLNQDWDIAVYCPPPSATWGDTFDNYYKQLSGQPQSEQVGTYRYYKLSKAQKDFLNLPPQT